MCSECLLLDVLICIEVLCKEDIVLCVVIDFLCVVELINGLCVESNCQNCNISEVQLLGLFGVYNQFLFDGILLLFMLGSVYGLEQILVGFVDCIEVVKGGGLVLYGLGVVVGVINLILLLLVCSGGYVQVGVDVLKGMLQKNVDVWLDLVVKDVDVGLLVIVQCNWNSGIDYNGDGYIEIICKNFKVGGLQVWYVFMLGMWLCLDLQVIDEICRGGNCLDQFEYLVNIVELLGMKYWCGSVLWDQEIIVDVDFCLVYVFVDIDCDSFYGGLGDVVIDFLVFGYDLLQLDFDVVGSVVLCLWCQYGCIYNLLYYIDSQLNWWWGVYVLVFGVQYKYEVLCDDNCIGDGQCFVVLEDVIFYNLGVFIQDEWSLCDNVDLVLGVCVDKSLELDNVVFLLCIVLVWQVMLNLKWCVGIVIGFCVLEIFVEDVYVDMLGGEQVCVCNVDGLKEECVLIILFGFDWCLDLVDLVWSWDVIVFYVCICDIFVLGEIQCGDDGQLSQLCYNVFGLNVLGVEINFGW